MRTRSGAIREEKRPNANLVRIPHDPVNEVVLLAAVMVDARAQRYLDSISADSFYGKGHAAAWAALQELRRQGLAFDLATVRQVAGERVDVEQLGEYLRERPTPPPNLKHHAGLISWDRARVEATRGPVASFLEALRDPTSSPEAVRGLAVRLAEAFDGHGIGRYLRDPASVLREQDAELEERRSGRAIYPYGIEGLDRYEDGRYRMIPGAAPRRITLVCGVSGSGKTTVTARLVLELANAGKRVLYGAWEQGSGMSLELLATLSLQLSRTDVTTGAFDASEQREIRAEMERLSEFVRFFELPFGKERGERSSNERNLDLIHQYISDTTPDAFVADLFKRALVRTEPDEEEQALYRMQAIADRERCHAFLVQQLRLKDLESREDKRPTREGIKGSGAWVEVPDTILAIHRPALFKNVPDDVLQILILKQRYGVWPLAVEFSWDPEYGAIENGRSVEYDRPGEVSEDSADGFLGKEATPARGRRGKGRK